MNQRGMSAETGAWQEIECDNKEVSRINCSDYDSCYVFTNAFCLSIKKKSISRKCVLMDCQWLNTFRCTSPFRVLKSSFENQTTMA